MIFGENHFVTRTVFLRAGEWGGCVVVVVIVVFASCSSMVVVVMVVVGIVVVGIIVLIEFSRRINRINDLVECDRGGGV